MVKPKFKNIDDFLDYVGGNDDAKYFISQYPQIGIDSLKAFKRKYYEDRPLGAKFSERVFSYWLYKEVEEFSPTIERQKKLEIKLPLEPSGVSENEVNIKKTPDLYLQYNNRKILVEFKTNIDMVEKDLYKFCLYKEYGDSDKEVLFFIWEREDNRFYKRGKRPESQYHSMLRLAVDDSVIDEFVYFPIAEELDEEVLNDALEKLRSFLVNI